MLRSILFLLVLISVVTTPSVAYEAYSNSDLSILKEELEPEPRDYDLCRVAIDEVQEEFEIKENLLQTIASVESGRWNAEAGRRVSWPWTIHANGRGMYFKTKAEAVAAVQALQAKGIRNIDVGCMQINLRYHGKAFSSLDEAFEPEKNVAYSAKFLRKLYNKNKSWKKTAMQYHSKNLRRGINYKNRLEKHFAQFVREDKNIVLFGG